MQQTEQNSENIDIEPMDHIDSSEKKIIDETSYCMSFCNGFCCQHYAVIITPFDVRRILDNLPFLDVNRIIEFKQWSDTSESEFPQILLNGEIYYIGLRSTQDQCIFQTGIGICGIYTFRPDVCRKYPWKLTSVGELA